MVLELGKGKGEGEKCKERAEGEDKGEKRKGQGEREERAVIFLSQISVGIDMGRKLASKKFLVPL